MGDRGLRYLKNECYDGAEQKRDYIDMKVEWLSGGEDFVREGKNFIIYALLNFKPVKRSESKV